VFFLLKEGKEFEKSGQVSFEGFSEFNGELTKNIDKDKKGNINPIDKLKALVVSNGRSFF
jgi:hypothetical protein